MKRLFLALPLSHSAAAQLWDAWETLRFTSRKIRWIQPEQFHITLAFLGDVNEELIPRIVDIMEETGEHYPPVSIRTGGPGHFPLGKTPKVLFESLESGRGGVGKIQRHLVCHLASLVELERRKFHPHVTIARVKPGDCLTPGYFPGLEIPHVEDRLSEIVLFESVLRPEGAVYYDLHRTLLTLR